MSTEVRVASLPDCDFCPKDRPAPAAYDARTTQGPWANICEVHWPIYGIGQLGTGYGQRLILADTDPATTATMPDVDKIIAWESGELDEEGTLELFGGLIASGLAWSLQGTYGRTARDLIEGGYISETGEVLA